MEKEASQLEKDHVHSVYEKIAPHFHDTRYKAWPKVQQFLSDQESGSLIADIGCGNGKYLHINSETYKLGCDYCFPLVELARNDGHEVMVCHNLCLPYRNECFDAVLSIAVIHHFSTKERRVRAIKEMARILRGGGQIMIYVWAMEQKRRKFEKQDVFVPWNPSLPSWNVVGSGELLTNSLQQQLEMAVICTAAHGLPQQSRTNLTCTVNSSPMSFSLSYSVMRAISAILLWRAIHVGDPDAAMEGFAGLSFPNCFRALDDLSVGDTIIPPCIVADATYPCTRGSGGSTQDKPTKLTQEQFNECLNWAQGTEE
ncbi:putative tRNA methyltransferase 9B [Carettochelys insculpta]|uniref:putative tRNA methyltransferase 9B n=1 Tax=Carettochelys insculpta TaxID=44489 RepID=UPI003EBEF992